MQPPDFIQFPDNTNRPHCPGCMNNLSVIFIKRRILLMSYANQVKLRQIQAIM